MSYNEKFYPYGHTKCGPKCEKMNYYHEDTAYIKKDPELMCQKKGCGPNKYENGEWCLGHIGHCPKCKKRTGSGLCPRHRKLEKQEKRRNLRNH